MALSAAASAHSIPPGGLAVVVGANGGIGHAVLEQLGGNSRYSKTLGLGRRSTPPLDLEDEPSIRAAAEHIAALGIPLRLVLVTTVFLHGGGFEPEKALKQLDPHHMAMAFAVNVIGPALLMKHLLPLLAPQG